MGIFSEKTFVKNDYGTEFNAASIPKNVARAIASVLVAATALQSVVTIGETDRGLKYEFGKLVSVNDGQILKPGLHFKIPYMQSVRKESVAFDQEKIEGVQTYTKDGQPITGDLTYMVRAPQGALVKLARENPNWRSKIQSDILDSFKGAMGKHEATKIAGSRNEIMSGVNKDVSAELLRVYGVEVTNVNMVNFDFTDQFEKSVEQAAAAKAMQIQKQTELESARIDAQKVQVDADANAYKVQKSADATAYTIKQTKDAEAEGYKLLEGVLGEDGLQVYILAKQWKGNVPQVTGAGNTITDLRGAIGAPAP